MALHQRSSKSKVGTLTLPIVLSFALAYHPTAHAQDWGRTDFVDPMTDFESVEFSRSADLPVSINWGVETPMLTIACDDDETVVAVDWGASIVSDGSETRFPVRYRINSLAAVSDIWRVSSSFEDIELRSGLAVGLLRRIHAAGEGRLLVEITPYGNDTVLATFDTGGIRAAIEVVALRCAWTIPNADIVELWPSEPIVEPEDPPVEAPPIPDDILAEISNAVRACWNVDVGAVGASTIRIEIEVEMGSDGFVRSAGILDYEGEATNLTLRAAAQGALRAVSNPRCQPFPAPQGGFIDGQTFVLWFDPIP